MVKLMINSGTAMVDVLEMKTKSLAADVIQVFVSLCLKF